MKILGLEIKRTSRQTQRRSAAPYRLRAGDFLRTYDAAAINRHNIKHFLNADGRDADALIRESLPTLRNRARYEIRNNSYAKGITETKANDIVGTGPRLQLQSEDTEFDRKAEDGFGRWMLDCDAGGKMTFADILRLAGSLQQDDSGESITILTNAEQEKQWTKAKPQVRLRLQIIEPDRVTTPIAVLGNIGLDTEKIRDGVEVDEFGRPQYYYILKKHPGSTSAFGGFGAVGQYDKVPAAYVIHLYRQDRPGQTRGVPWFTPAIPLFAYLRRWTLATIAAAETAANISAVLETVPSGIEVDAVEVGEEVEIARNAMLTLPDGAKMNQFKPEQPSSTYKEFKAEILNEIARCLNMPYNVAAANSSGYNYASGRLDWQVYFRFIKTVQGWIERKFCNRVFFAWLKEAMLTPGLQLPMVNPFKLKVQWFWPGQEHVDPVKEAVAQRIKLKESKTTNLANEYAKQGQDWERELEQRARELEKIKELGLDTETILPKTGINKS